MTSATADSSRAPPRRRGQGPLRYPPNVPRDPGRVPEEGKCPPPFLNGGRAKGTAGPAAIPAERACEEQPGREGEQGGPGSERARGGGCRVGGGRSGGPGRGNAA